ncbi:hypothetical protein PIB30_055005 [Stylosanthes scabra]|uniref:Uncharacterized protein n=1 Tax=Stylosanthes scabra TaxID=79078 RepID=A0ABU6YGD6_9FABA|nr:hypothetical protein [Stylosanthes scabra]
MGRDTLQHCFNLSTVITDGHLDTGPTDGTAVDTNIIVVGIAAAEVAAGAAGGWGSYEIVQFRRCPYLSRHYG